MTQGAAIAFNTLKFANRLKAVGVKPEHAEAEAEALAEVLEVNLSGLATKEDLQRLEASQHKDMTAMEDRFNARLDKLWLQLLISISGVVVVALGLFTKFFGH